MSSGDLEFEPGTDNDRDSRFVLEIALRVGYHRKRAAVEGKWEGRFITLVLLIAGVPATIWVIYEIITRVGNG